MPAGRSPMRVVSDAQMAAKLPERRIPFWQARIADPNDVVLIAEDDADRAQGFVHAGPVLDHDIRKGSLAGFDCEIYSLHCRKDVQGRELGRLLTAETARAFQERGRTALMLWAYRDNPYRKFYEKIGGEILAEGFDDDIPDVAYGWPLTRLHVGHRPGQGGAMARSSGRVLEARLAGFSAGSAGAIVLAWEATTRRSCPTLLACAGCIACVTVAMMKLVNPTGGGTRPRRSIPTQR